MNILNICCCGQKQKPPQLKPKIVSKKQNLHINNTIHSNIKQPTSQPFNLSDKYKGEQLNNKPHGNGQMMYKNGDYYRGQWVQGQKQGRGLQIYHQKNYKYEGQWKSNLPDGQGKIIFQNGSYYVGEFKQNNKHGKGEYYDVEKKILCEQWYENGQMKNQKVKSNQQSREEEFPTLVLDKERFNSEDLIVFQKENPQIKQLEVNFLTKYYAICKIINVSFLRKNMKEWDDKEVRQFLQSIQLTRCKEVFYKNKIKGNHLATITQKQMKQDLKMKLGDRKRLVYHIKYLTQIYNEQKKKKQNGRRNSLDKQKKMTQRNFSLDSKKHQKFITSFVQQHDIIQQQNQIGSDQIFENSEKFSQNFQQQQQKQSISVSPRKNKQLNEHNFYTSQWNQNYSSHQIYSMSQNFDKQKQQHIGLVQSQQNSSRESTTKLNRKSSINKTNIKKNSQNQIDDLINVITQKSRILNNREISGIEADMSDNKELDHKKYKDDDDDQQNNNNNATNNNIINQKDKRKDTSSSESSESSLSDQSPPELIRKRTTAGKNREGGMQIRQLYQFLRQRGNLQFIIKQRQIQILQLIGQGSYGKVYKGKYMSCPVAVKDYIKTGKHQIQQDFLKQLQILSDLKHPNIVLYMGICITTDKYQLVTQYLQNGSLFDSIHKKKIKFTRSQVLQIIDDIVKGMVYLHNMKNIMHRDLKSSNVLLDQDLKVKLCDFGLSGHKKKSKKKNSGGRIGTYQWMAPEVMKKEEMDFSSDVYSFGVIVWELLTNKIPYENYKKHQIIGEVGYDDNYKLRIKQGESQWPQDDFIVLIMNQCLNRQASKRPTFIQIQSKLNSYMSMIDEKNVP